MRIYLASSWRNEQQPVVLEALRIAGHDVYDFRHPAGEGSDGFAWADIGHDIGHAVFDTFSARELAKMLEHPRAAQAFHLDMGALIDCEACVLLAPCGNSAHLEAGWARGNGKPLIVFVPHPMKIKPELMYLMADHMVSTVPHLVELLELVQPQEHVS